MLHGKIRTTALKSHGILLTTFGLWLLVLTWLKNTDQAKDHSLWLHLHYLCFAFLFKRFQFLRIAFQRHTWHIQMSTGPYTTRSHSVIFTATIWEWFLAASTSLTNTRGNRKIHGSISILTKQRMMQNLVDFVYVLAYFSNSLWWQLIKLSTTILTLGSVETWCICWCQEYSIYLASHLWFFHFFSRTKWLSQFIKCSSTEDGYLTQD